MHTRIVYIKGGIKLTGLVSEISTPLNHSPDKKSYLSAVPRRELTSEK